MRGFNLKPVVGSLLLALPVFVLPVHGLAAVRVFHSPNDDGVPSPAQAVLGPGAHTLHLYMETGAVASQSAPCDTGDGEEVCQWVIDTIGEGQVTLQSFSPIGDVKWVLGAKSLTATGGDSEFGQLGVFKLGDLVVLASGIGSVAISRGEVALADLSLFATEDGDLVLLPEPSSWLPLAAGACFLTVLYRVRIRRIA